MGAINELTDFANLRWVTFDDGRTILHHVFWFTPVLVGGVFVLPFDHFVFRIGNLDPLRSLCPDVAALEQNVFVAVTATVDVVEVIAERAETVYAAPMGLNVPSASGPVEVVV